MRTNKKVKLNFTILIFHMGCGHCIDSMYNVWSLSVIKNVNNDQHIYKSSNKEKDKELLKICDKCHLNLIIMHGENY